MTIHTAIPHRASCLIERGHAIAAGFDRIGLTFSADLTREMVKALEGGASPALYEWWIAEQEDRLLEKKAARNALSECGPARPLPETLACCGGAEAGGSGQPELIPATSVEGRGGGRAHAGPSRFEIAAWCALYLAITLVACSSPWWAV